MPKFSTHVALMSPEYQAVSFGPGDEVPEWAIDQVGAHVLEAEDPADSDESGDSESDDEADGEQQGDEDGDSDEADGDGSDDEVGEADGESSDDSAPDFTKPAPARRGRSRKQ